MTKPHLKTLQGMISVEDANLPRMTFFVVFNKNPFVNEAGEVVYQETSIEPYVQLRTLPTDLADRIRAHLRGLSYEEYLSQRNAELPKFP